MCISSSNTIEVLQNEYFSTLHTTLSHNFIKEKLTELIEQTFNREGLRYLTCDEKHAFFTSEQFFLVSRD